MGLPQFKEKRLSFRRPLIGDLTGQLLTEGDCRRIPCLAMNVSNAGLGILAREELTPGSTLVLAFDDSAISLCVVWCQPDAKTAGFFNAGLVTVDPRQDLLEFFISIGWL